jgi:hypothetical protein
MSRQRSLRYFWLAAIPFLVAGATRASAPALENLFGKYREGALTTFEVLNEVPRQAEARGGKALTEFTALHRNDFAAAAFLLEGSEASYRLGRALAPKIFDAALGIAESAPAGQLLEQSWYQAALALVEGRGAGLDLGSVRAAGGGATADLHVFPGDSRSPESTLDRISSKLPVGDVALARGVLKQQIGLNGLLVIRSLKGSAGLQQETIDGQSAVNDVSANRTRDLNMQEERKFLGTAIDLFEAAEKYPEVRAEARLRRAGTLLFIGQNESALHGGDHAEAAEVLVELEGRENEGSVRFLALFLHGEYLQALGDFLAAAEKFQGAADLFPKAYSSRIALLNAQFLQGQAIDLEGLRQSLVNSPARSADPWFKYRYGNYADWDVLVERLRNAVQKARN